MAPSSVIEEGGSSTWTSEHEASEYPLPHHCCQPPLLQCLSCSSSNTFHLAAPASGLADNAEHGVWEYNQDLQFMCVSFITGDFLWVELVPKSFKWDWTSHYFSELCFFSCTSESVCRKRQCLFNWSFTISLKVELFPNADSGLLSWHFLFSVFLGAWVWMFWVPRMFAVQWNYFHRWVSFSPPGGPSP